MGCMKMAEILAQSVYYIFRDYLIILTLASPPTPDYRWGGHATLSPTTFGWGRKGEGGVSIRHGGQGF